MEPRGVVQHFPTNRDAWLALRKQDVTASQIAALIGHHPHVTPFQLYAEKIGALVDDADDSNPAMRRGRMMEAVAVECLREELPHDAVITHNSVNHYWRDPNARIGATPDVLVQHPTRGLGVVQCKSVEPSIYRKNWENGEPPLWIVLQALTEAQLVGAQWAAVAAVRVGFGLDFDLTDIPLHAGAWAGLRAKAADFWRAVDAGLPMPPDFTRDGPVIESLYRQSSGGSSIDLGGDNELINALHEREDIKARLKELERECDQLDGLIRFKAGQHEVVTAGDFRVTLRSEERAAYTVKAGTRRPLRVKRLNGSNKED